MYAAPIAQQPIVAGTTVQQQQHAVDQDKQRSKYEEILYKIGMAELSCGVLFILSAIASLGSAIVITNKGPPSYFYYSTFGIVYVLPGIWCGIFPMISGILGICARKNTSSCIYGANMIMAIITAIFMTILFGISLPSAIIVTHEAIITFQILNTIGSFAIFIVSIVHSAYCCAGICCVPPTTNTRVAYATQPAMGQHYVQLANGQYMHVQSPAPVPQAYVVAGAHTAMPMATIVPSQQPGYVQPGSSAPPYPAPFVQHSDTEQTKQNLQADVNPPSYNSMNYPVDPVQYNSMNYPVNPDYPQSNEL